MKTRLDLTPAELLSAAEEICGILGGLRAEREDAPVLSPPGGRDLAAVISEPLPRRGTPLKSLLGEIRKKVLPAVRRNDSPRFFGYVCSGGSDAGALADFLASGLNQNVTAWRSAPAATEMERLVIEWIRLIVGMPEESEGLLLGGGSAATLTALAAARDTMAGADVSAGGLLTLGREMTLYGSDQVHMSAPRAAAMLGLGREALRALPSLADLTIDMGALARAVEEDRRAGRLPFCVVANAGSTATGAIDPLEELAHFCESEGLWLHVDAAYGGFAALSSAAAKLAGLGRAHSLAIDPHKWLHVPFDCGAVIVRDAGTLRVPFSEVGSYARTEESDERESHTFFEHGPELSRRFRALKVWLTLRHLGTDHIGRLIDHDLATASHLAALVESADDLELLAPAPLSTVCFRYAAHGLSEGDLDGLNRRILRRIQSESRVYPTHAIVRGRFGLRACILNPRTSRADVELLVSEVRRWGNDRGLRRP